MKVKYKSASDIEKMREGGRIQQIVLSKCLEEVKAGVKLCEIDDYAKSLIAEYNARASFLMVDGYDYATCININDGLVHGIPDQTVIREGDLVKIDLGVYFKGFHTDGADMAYVGTPNDEMQRFMAAGRNSVKKAIDKAVISGIMSDISGVIQSEIEGNGYSISRDLVGHGVGKSLHEDPQVPGFIERWTRNFVLKEGLVIAIEVIYAQKSAEGYTDENDYWTIRTKDGSIAGLYEKTVAVTKDGPVIITI